MKLRFAASSVHQKPSMGRKSFDRKGLLLLGDKPNRCVIIPPKVAMVAETIERRDNSWFVRTKSDSDLVVRIGDGSRFHLHMLPMVSRSGYLNRMAFQSKNARENPTPIVELHNLPGGASTFELVVKFCYGWKVDLTVNNIASLYCAAHFLEMTDDFETSNLISSAESFLSFLMLSSWKDTLRVLKTCENISSCARDLCIQTRCSEAIAWKICAEDQCFEFMERGGGKFDGWWFEDVSALRIDHFIEVVASLKKKGMKSELLGSCICYWTAKWLSKQSFRRVVVESLIRILPAEENSVSCNFLLHLLKVGLMMNVDRGLLLKLEGRIAAMLDRSQPSDLLVKNYGESETLYDVKVVVRVVEAYVSRNCSSKMFVVGRLVDGFLRMVARDSKLQAKDFQLLTEALPKNARYSDDNLYKAIDIYLKAHPDLTEEERIGVSRSMEHHKLSQEARRHAMKNERLPLNITAHFILLEQVAMARSMTESGMGYRRTRSQAVVGVCRDEREGLMCSRREVKTMKVEVEKMRAQLGEVRLYRMEIKRMANVGFGCV